MSNTNVQFEVLIHARDSGQVPSVATIDSFKPDPADLIHAKRWFTEQGITAHQTDFGLVCSAPKNIFESIFDVTLTENENQSSQVAFNIVGQISAPSELKDIIEQVTLSVQPEYY